MKTNSKEMLNNTLEQIIEKVETAGSWIKPFKSAIVAGMPINYQTKAEYKGMNIFSLWLEAVGKGFNSNKWLTFKQCKTLGGTVLKGEKATPIYFFKPLKIKEENKQGELKDKIIPMLKMYYVFNIAQTTLKDEEVEEAGEVEELEHIERCKSFFDNLDFLEVKSTSSQPSYNCTQDFINMPDKNNFISIGEYYSTLGHEYIHSTGHETRNKREMSNKKEDYAFEELIAELGSIFLMAHLGIKEEAIQDNSAAYLKSWLKALKSDPKYLWKAGAEAQKAFNYLIEHTENKNLSLAS